MTNWGPNTKYKCLEANTEIYLYGTNEIVTIEEMYHKSLLLGNDGVYSVYSYSPGTNTVIEGQVIDIVYNGYWRLHELTLSNGNKIKCTRDHKFLSAVSKDYVKVKNLAPGYELLAVNLEGEHTELVTVDKIEWIEEKAYCYDLEVRPNLNVALVAGIYAHNCCISQGVVHRD
ncbi:dCTP deaminase [Bacillus phage vB_BceM-HSE3]|nr:dCTP deaminase [Bacillus phage vB_BceM-HSE3]